MRILKFLQISACIAAIAALTAVSGLSACSGGRAAASPASAEKYAVSLANDRCEKDFGTRPFKTGRFAAIRSGDRWLWGWLDGSAAGYTAQVSFRADRSEPEAKVYPSSGESFDMEAPNAPDLDFRPDTNALSRQPEPEN